MNKKTILQIVLAFLAFFLIELFIFISLFNFRKYVRIYVRVRTKHVTLHMQQSLLKYCYLFSRIQFKSIYKKCYLLD